MNLENWILLLPDQTLHNFRAWKSVGSRILWISKTSVDGWYNSKITNCSARYSSLSLLWVNLHCISSEATLIHALFHKIFCVRTLQWHSTQILQASQGVEKGCSCRSAAIRKWNQGGGKGPSGGGRRCVRVRVQGNLMPANLDQVSLHRSIVFCS